MNRLPFWALTGKHGAFYDTESATAIEQTAKVYGAMNELIDEYNAFVLEVTNKFTEFKESSDKNIEEFTTCIINTVSNYIQMIDSKMDDATNYMKSNLQATAEVLLNEIIAELREDMTNFELDREYFRAEFEKNTATINSQNTIIASAIDTMETRLDAQDSRIDEAVAYMQANISNTVNTAVANLIEDGEIVMGVVYDETTEDMRISARNVTYDTDLALDYDESTESILIRES